MSGGDQSGAPPAQPLAIVCGGGNLPFAVADAVIRGGRRVVLFALRGWADPHRTEAYPHHWIALGQFGRFKQLARQEGCRDVLYIGNLVRPALSQIRLDLATLRVMPRIVAAFRGGDDHMLSGIARIMEDHGLRVVGVADVAPQVLMPEGVVGGRKPSQRDYDDIERGRAALAAIGPFDVGQAVVVAQGHVLAVEAAEGTDLMLERVAALRQSGRIRAPAGTGVLVKVPKPGQDRRLDLPSIGPHTFEKAGRAGLAGVAVAAGAAVVDDLQAAVKVADREGLFILGLGGRG